MLFSFNSFSQEISNRGKEFWLGYGFNSGFFPPHPGFSDPINAQDLSIYISTELPATVTVSITGTSWTQTLNIPANTVNATIVIPKAGADDARILTDGLTNRSIHIQSNVPVAVYAHMYSVMYSAATMLLPVEAYGYSYYAVNYPQTMGQAPTPPQPGPNSYTLLNWYSWFYIVATDDNTRINITPSDTTKNGWLPGQTYTVNLNKGEIYNVFGKAEVGASISTPLYKASKDMTGSKIISVPGNDGVCHPVAVFSGSGGIHICQNDGGEGMQQQVFPTQAWGTRYLTYHTVNNTMTDINETNRNYYRVCVQDPTTVVKRNGVVLTGLVNNFFYEFGDSTGGDYIEANKPILVAQYTPNKNQCWDRQQNSYGDPEMFYLSALEQGQKSILFYTTRNKFIDYVYTNIIVPTSALASLRVDGNPVPAANTRTHPNNPAYTVALARIMGAAAQHTITCDSAVTGQVYGLGYYESYGYNIGTYINNLNYYSQIKNTFSSQTSDSVTCPKTPVRLFIKIGMQASQITWKLSQVPGLTPNTDSVINNPVPVAVETINGRTYYVYTLQQDFSFANTGTYYIPVTYSAPVIENCNQTENAQVKVVVRPGPKADFSFPSPSCLINTIPFTGTSIPGTFNITNYTWFFHDNTTANTVNATKLYPAPGNYDVRYRILADNGCAGDTTKTVTILENPTAAFSISGNICTKDSVRITDNSTVPVGTISSWYWNFGDGNSVTLTNNTPFYHQYNTAGTYTIYLVTTSSNGCKSDTTRIPVTVMPRPTASFTTGGNVCLGDSIRFIDASTPAGSISSWNWNFGDTRSEIRTNNAPFFHTYTSTGNFNVTLVVTGTNTCASDTFRFTVNVSSKPPSTFTVTGKPCIDSLFSFTSSVPTGGSNPPTWYWNFGDNQTGNSAVSNSITHAYSNAATNIVVKHWVSYAAGCASDTAFQTIPLVRANPVAAFTITGDTLCEKRPITLNSTVTGTHFWNWNLGPTSSNATPPFNYQFNTAGTYDIRLFLSNPEGCKSATVSQSITINPIPAINAGPDKMINAGTSTTIDATITNPGNYSFLWTPTIYLDADNILNPVSTPDATTTYTIQAMDKLSKCIGTDQVIISPITGLYIPSAFTPNRDGKNDDWQIPGLALYPDARIQVFNRAGQLVFDQKGYTSNTWDGSFRGTQQPIGVYVYQIRLNDGTGRVLKGTVSIIR